MVLFLLLIYIQEEELVVFEVHPKYIYIYISDSGDDGQDRK